MWATVTHTSFRLTADKELLQRVKEQESIGGDTLPVWEQNSGSTLLSAAFKADCILHQINFTWRNMVWKLMRYFYTRWNISVIDASAFFWDCNIFWLGCLQYQCKISLDFHSGVASWNFQNYFKYFKWIMQLFVLTDMLQWNYKALNQTTALICTFSLKNFFKFTVSGLSSEITWKLRFFCKNVYCWFVFLFNRSYNSNVTLPVRCITQQQKPSRGMFILQRKQKLNVSTCWNMTELST